MHCVSTQPEPESNGAEGARLGVALVMVLRGERGSASVRLVQDLGGRDGPAPSLPVEPLKRGRGRPRGSRNKKPG